MEEIDFDEEQFDLVKITEPPVFDLGLELSKINPTLADKKALKRRKRNELVVGVLSEFSQKLYIIIERMKHQYVEVESDFEARLIEHCKENHSLEGAPLTEDCCSVFKEKYAKLCVSEYHFFIRLKQISGMFYTSVVMSIPSICHTHDACFQVRRGFKVVVMEKTNSKPSATNLRKMPSVTELKQ